MTSHYVCRSCLRALLRLQHQPVNDSQRLRRSLTTTAPAASESPRRPNRPLTREVDQNHPSQFERSVDDDFLERLLAGRDPSHLVGLYSGAPTKAGDASNVGSVVDGIHLNDGSTRRMKTFKSHGVPQEVLPQQSTAKEEISQHRRDMDGLVQQRSAEGSPLIYRPYSRRQRVEAPPPFPAINQGRYVNSSLGLRSGSSSNQTTANGTSLNHSGRSEEDVGADLLDIFPPQRLARHRDNDYVEAPTLNDYNLKKEAERLVGNPRLTAQQSWDGYQRLFGHYKTSPMFLKRIQSKLIGKITFAWCEDQKSTIRPTEAIYCLPFLIRAGHIRHSVIWTVLSFINKTYAVDSTSLGVEQRALINELLQVWFLSIHKRGYSSVSRTVSKTDTDHMRLRQQWQTLTSLFLELQQSGQLPKPFKDRFRMFFDSLGLNPNDKDKNLDTAMLVTFLIVHHYETTTHLNSTVRINQPEFIELISSMMSYSDISERLEEHKSAIQSMLMDGNTYAEALTRQLEAATVQSLSIYAEARSAREARNSQAPSSAAPRTSWDLMDFFQKRLERIIKSRQGSKLDPLFEEAKLAFQKPHSSDHLFPNGLYSHFLTAYMTFRRPAKAIEIWNTMVKEGLEISVATWTAMLKGCGMAKDAKTLQIIWQKMLSAGVKPDAQAWATLIDAYARCRRIDQAIETFQEMAAVWTRALPDKVQRSQGADLNEFGDIGDIPKPNAHCVNVLVDHLVKSKDHKNLSQLLSWAGTLGIEPDAYTLNPLFSSALEDEDLDLAGRILSQMHERSITPDVASFSLFISWFFRNGAQQSQNGEDPEQLMNVKNVFDLIENAGMGVNAQTFAALVNTLLQNPATVSSTHNRDAESNLAAAYAILDYMTDRSIPISVQIYTTLITYHLKYQTPPDLVAVDALWTRARSGFRAGVVLDTVFYDRLIEGLSQANQSRKAMLALSQAARSGISPSWPALRLLVLANLRAGDATGAAELVEGVRREEGQAHERIRSDFGKKEFWRTCEHEGLGGQYLPVEDSPVLQTRGGVTSTLDI